MIKKALFLFLSILPGYLLAQTLLVGYQNSSDGAFVHPLDASVIGETYKSIQDLNCNPLVNSSAGTNWSPAIESFGGNLVAVYKQNNLNGNLILAVSTSAYLNCWNIGSSFDAFYSKRSSYRTSLESLNGMLYMAYSYNNNIYTSYSSDGYNWSSGRRIPGVQTSNAPTLAAFNNKLFITYRGVTSKTVYVQYSVNGGYTWSAPVSLGMKTDNAPYIAAFNGELYVAYRGASNDRIYIQRSSNGLSWSAAWQPNSSWRTSTGPAIQEYNNKLYIAFTGQSSSRIYYSSSTNGSSSWTNASFSGNKASRSSLTLSVY